jgi:hypothetical protein
MPHKDPEVRRAYCAEQYRKKKHRWKNPDGFWKRSSVPAEVRNARNRERWEKDEAWRDACKANRKRSLDRKRVIGMCPMCGSGPLQLYRDHCHATGKDRGRICSHCNLMLGHALDSVETLKRAITYLERSSMT